MIATPNPQRISIEEYLDWEPLQELRFEYANGTIIAMAGGTVRHNDIAVNLLTLLHGAVRTRGCRININDVKLQVITKGAYRYPDLVVTCDSRDLQNGELLEYPTVIVEVLSPGTEAIDRGDKFNEYRTLDLARIRSDQCQQARGRSLSTGGRANVALLSLWPWRHHPVP
jgi:Uma2 family endonuclease